MSAHNKSMQHANFVSLLQLREHVGQIDDDVLPSEEDLQAIEQEIITGWYTAGHGKDDVVEPLFASRPHWVRSPEVADFLIEVLALNLEHLLCDYESASGYVGPAIVTCSLYTMEQATTDFGTNLESEEIDNEYVVFPRI